MNRIAVLLTCHNRKQKTLDCLKALFRADLPANCSIDTFLVDDGSKDGTGEAVAHYYPQVHLIYGNGSLFWNQGMRLAWKTAVEHSRYDYYLWLNDDTLIDPNALNKLLDNYESAKEISGCEAIITGACRASSETNEFSYGGRSISEAVIPDGTVRECVYINGNCVLIPDLIFKEVGNLSEKYTHAIGDFDYGLNAIKKGFKCFTTDDYVAVCPPNPGVPGWCDPKKSLAQRWKLFHSPRGLNIQEYLHYRKVHFGYKSVVVTFFKSYSKLLVPQIYNSLK